MFALSPEQTRVIADLSEWYEKDRQAMPYVTVGGYAGTGKTTLIAGFRKKFYVKYPKLKTAFASFTGKAARVLSDKLKHHHALVKGDTVGTIHSLIYSPVVNDQEEIVGWERKEKIAADIVIIDEASMVDREIWGHLLSYKIPVIAVGDHGQLPPVGGQFSLMAKPHLLLETIHRQEAGNPIISLSARIRAGEQVPAGRLGKTVVKYSLNDPESQEYLSELLGSFSPETLLLCGLNHTRRRLNAHIRQALGIESQEPVAGDRVICLRNNHKKGVMNGMLGTIRKINRSDEVWYEAEIAMDGGDINYQGKIARAQFGAAEQLNFSSERGRTIAGDLFNFGYATTVHKAQGSEARRVILIEERFSKMDDEAWRRWLYTAVTRAREELYIFGR